MIIITRRAALKGLGTAALALPAIATVPSLALAQSSPDEYATRTLENGLFSKKTSELALERASSDMIPTFANLEIAEVEAVTEVLTSTGAQAPDDVDGEHAALMEKLMGLEGDATREFDAAYVDGQIMTHEELLAIQKPMADMSEVTLPVATAKIAVASIESHIAMLQGIRQAL